MDLLSAQWTRARHGQGQVVCLFGEAGVGKSRLAYEFQRTLIEARTLQAQTLSYGQAMPYHAFIPLLRTLLGLRGNDDPSDQRQQIRARLQALHPKLVDDEPLLSHLLGVPIEPDQLPNVSLEARKRRLQSACLRLIMQYAADRPLCLLIEDLHWLDHSSQEVLGLLVAALTKLPILLLGTARPGFHHTWDNLTYFHRLTVEPLADEHIDALIRDYFHPYDASVALKELIRERTGGNPFFVEEILQAIRERSLAARQGDVYVLKGDAHIEVPASIHGVLAARIDRLPPEVKYLLQVAAVIGKDVPDALLQAIAELSAEALHRDLMHLQAAEFLHEVRFFPDREYTFKHALTHEVAYGSPLQERRRVLHARIVEAIERLYCDRVAEQVEQLAHHALRGELWDKALVYFRQAGAKAFARWANREAVECFEQALVALQHRPERRDTMEQSIDLRNALYPLGELAQILEHLREAEALAEALEDQRRLGRVSFYMSQYFWTMGEPARAIESGHRALATAADDFALRIGAHFNLGNAYHALGNYRQAVDYFRRNVASLKGELIRERFGMAGFPSVTARAWLAWCLAELGAFGEGLSRGEESVWIA
jgi:predicted ATPase